MATQSSPPRNIAFIGDYRAVSHLQKTDKWGEQQGYVYLSMLSNDLCKIGSTTHPKGRFKALGLSLRVAQPLWSDIMTKCQSQSNSM